MSARRQHKKPNCKRVGSRLLIAATVAVMGGTVSGCTAALESGASSQSEDVQSGTGADTQAAPERDLTPGQENAIGQAENYLNTSSFSRTGLIAQLEFEGYSSEDATFAVDDLAVDWNEQAAKKAQEYLDTSNFSGPGLIDQLEFEGFTPEQAAFGAAAVGY
jgi:flagellar capping protein FliD